MMSGCGASKALDLLLIASMSTHGGVAWRRMGEAATISRQAKYKLSRAMRIANAGRGYWMLSLGTLIII
jgi:hypothetical protein